MMTSRTFRSILSGMPDDWAGRLTKRIGDAIKDLRVPRSGQWLEDRTAELGHRVSRSTISEIETGRRRSITISDLVVLAAALETAPIALIYPPPYSEDIEVLPGVTRRKIDAVQEFSGFVEPGVGSPEYARNVFELNRARLIAEALRAQDKYATTTGILEGTYPAEDERGRRERVRERLASLKADDGW
jgi:transcriptional regulator with XRE-family HTH domain